MNDAEMPLEEVPPFHRSITYWIAALSWFAMLAVGVLLSVNRSRFASIVLAILTVVTGIGAVPISEWQAGVTIAE